MKMRKLAIFISLTVIAVSFAELPPEMRRDQYKAKLADYLNVKDFKSAKPYLIKAIELEKQGYPIGGSFDFFAGEIFIKTGDYFIGGMYIEKYLKENGREAKYYKQALSLYSEAEPYIIKEKEKQLQIQKEKKERAAAIEIERAKHQKAIADSLWREELYKKDLSNAKKKVNALIDSLELSIGGKTRLVPPKGMKLIPGSKHRFYLNNKWQELPVESFFMDSSVVTVEDFSNALNYAINNRLLKGYTKKNSITFYCKKMRRGNRLKYNDPQGMWIYTHYFNSRESRFIKKFGMRYDENKKCFYVPEEYRFKEVELEWYQALFYCNIKSLMNGYSPAYRWDTFYYNGFAGMPEFSWPRDKNGTGFRLPTKLKLMYVQEGHMKYSSWPNPNQFGVTIHNKYEIEEKWNKNQTSYSRPFRTMIDIKRATQ